MGVGAVRPPHSGFFPFLKKSSGNPFFQIIVADAFERKNSNLVLPPLRVLLGQQ